MGIVVLIGVIVQNLYGIIDLYWVGHLGTESVAAVALANNVLLAVLATTQMLAVGTSALVAQASGRQDRTEVARLFNQSMLVGVAVGALLTLSLFLLRREYSDWLAGDARTSALTQQFLAWFAPAMFLQFVMVVLASALRGIGDVRSAALAQVGTVVLNMILAPLLIFGVITGRPAGVTGAAVATLISVAVGALFLFGYVIRRKRHFSFRPAAWVPDLALWWQVMRIGLPSALEFGIMALSFGFVMAVIQPFGPAAQAAFGVGMRILQFGVAACMAFSFAAAAVIGQNYGARSEERVRAAFRAVLMINLLISAVFVALVQLAPQRVLGWFSQGDEEMIRIGAELLRILGWNVVATGVAVACNAVFSGLGNTLPSLASSATRLMLIVGSVLWLRDHAQFQLRWIWQISLVAMVVQASINLFFVRRQLAERFGAGAAVQTVLR